VVVCRPPPRRRRSPAAVVRCEVAVNARKANEMPAVPSACSGNAACRRRKKCKPVFVAVRHVFLFRRAARRSTACPAHRQQRVGRRYAATCRVGQRLLQRRGKCVVACRASRANEGSAAGDVRNPQQRTGLAKREMPLCRAINGGGSVLKRPGMGRGNVPQVLRPPCQRASSHSRSRENNDAGRIGPAEGCGMVGVAGRCGGVWRVCGGRWWQSEKGTGGQWWKWEVGNQTQKREEF